MVANGKSQTMLHVNPSMLLDLRHDTSISENQFFTFQKVTLHFHRSDRHHGICLHLRAIDHRLYPTARSCCFCMVDCPASISCDAGACLDTLYMCSKCWPVAHKHKQADANHATSNCTKTKTANWHRNGQGNHDLRAFCAFLPCKR